MVTRNFPEDNRCSGSRKVSDNDVRLVKPKVRHQNIKDKNFELGTTQVRTNPYEFYFDNSILIEL